MIVSPDIYNGGAQPNFAMNCGLQYDTRHSIFPGLSMESHWIPHHSPIASVKQEPRDDSEYASPYGQKSSPPGSTSFQSPLTPPGLNQGGHTYTYPTPPQAADYRSPPHEYTPPTAPPQMAPSPPAPEQPQQRPPSAPADGEALKNVGPAASPGLTPPGSLPSPTHEPHQEKPPSDPHQDSSQSSNSENEFYENGDSLRRLQLALQRTGMMPEEKLQCPMCDFTCSVRSQFNEHLVSHETKCPACDFCAETSEKLKEHVRANHENLPDMDHMWAEDEPGLTTPKVNSQGKVKTFRCKQCDFAAVTKLEFWEHSRTHIKQERLLTCPKCPFVTEYKHHLEYHLRNHFGSKPFKCDRCSYSCVNKSMLNSHLKSHSNVYQFRCADCTYATKYCHSLKLHLRKYGHNPAMVLNPDGSPNPLPIVDVYGTRRGPKQKPKHHVVDKPAPTQRVSVPLFNPYSLLPTQMPYYNILNGFTPFPFGPDVKMDETNNNVEKEEILREECDERTPLDLTCPEQPESDNASNTSETPISKNRRKGKAFKLERIALRLHQPSDDESGMNKERADSPPTSGMASPEMVKCEADSDTMKPERNEKRDEYDCSYCDISFKDIVMYTMHMGYHGYQDPFTCNMCGQQTSDKVSFFLHIARTSHS